VRRCSEQRIHLVTRAREKRDAGISFADDARALLLPRGRLQIAHERVNHAPLPRVLRAALCAARRREFRAHWRAE
jgi:hypothetical protein